MWCPNFHPPSIQNPLLIPAQAVFCFHWRRNVTSLTRPSAASAVARRHRFSFCFGCWDPIIPVSSRGPCAPHQPGSLARVSRLANIDHAARSLVRSPSLLVASGNEEHGRSVKSCARDDADANADRLSAHWRGGSLVVAKRRAVALVARVRVRGVTTSGNLVVEVDAGEEWDGGVDHTHERLYRRVRVAVERGVGVL